MSKLYEDKVRGRWYFDFTHRGKRYYGSAESYDDAQEMLDCKRAGLRRDERLEEITGEKPFKPAPMKIEEALDDFYRRFCHKKKSAFRYFSIIKHLKARWHDKMLADIKAGDILDFRVDRETCGRAPATVRQELIVIGRFFKKQVALGRLKESPAKDIEKPEVPNDRVRFLEPDQMKALMDALIPTEENKVPVEMQKITNFARFTGARRGEIFKLRWADVDFKRGLLTFRDTKNGTTGTVEMNQTTRALLESLPKPFSQTQRVFENVKEHRFRAAWEGACLKAGLTRPCAFCGGIVTKGSAEKRCRHCEGKGVKPDFRFHDLRHQAATDLLTQGANLNDVRDFLRHKGVAMTLRYAHLVRERRVKTAALLDVLAAPGAVTSTILPTAPDAEAKEQVG